MTAECVPKEEKVTHISYIMSSESTSKNDIEAPILNEEIAETEADLELKPSPPVITTIKCGGISGKLVMNYFICPGIHQKCIQVEGCDELITPKEFTVRANKDKQKDWKGSIRIGKSNLRTLMEMGSFDFYDHQNRCSAKCQSRNYITPKEKEMMAEAAARRDSKPGDFDRNDSTLAALFKNPTFSQLPHLTQALKKRKTSSPIIEKTEKKESALQAALKTPPVKRESDNEASSSRANGFHQKSEELEKIISLMAVDPPTFWNEMVRLGTADGILNMMIDTLNGFRAKMSLGATTSASPFLSRTVVALGLYDSVAAMLRRKNSLSSLNMVQRLSTDYSSLEDHQVRKRSNPEASANPDIPAKRSSLPSVNMASFPAMLSQLVAFQKQQTLQKQLKKNNEEEKEETKANGGELNANDKPKEEKEEKAIEKPPEEPEVEENHLITALLTGQSPSEALLKMASNISPST